MVVDRLIDETVDGLFRSLADPTRRDILRRCGRGQLSVSQLAVCYPMSFAAVQKHVAVLEKAELVTKERKGREQLVRGKVETIRTAGRLLEELEVVWRGRIDRIEQILGDEKRGSRK
ncbi:MAG: metalloregulator ArsR/SmtB family transcription factor [Actinobacteria bacterium]|nr:metalloregulator ArsR/SmtB family transcription factor [Actinomycetota bacterium]